MLLRGGQEAQALSRRPRDPLRPVEAVEQAAAHLVLLQHRRHRFRLVDGRLPGAAALGVDGERGLQLVREAEVVHDQPARLVLEDAVHPRDRLHEAVPAHRLVHVHRVQAGRVEARQPHVADEHDLERVVRVLEPSCE